MRQHTTSIRNGLVGKVWYLLMEYGPSRKEHMPRFTLSVLKSCATSTRCTLCAYLQVAAWTNSPWKEVLKLLKEAFQHCLWRWVHHATLIQRQFTMQRLNLLDLLMTFHSPICLTHSIRFTPHLSDLYSTRLSLNLVELSLPYSTPALSWAIQQAATRSCDWHERIPVV